MAMQRQHGFDDDEDLKALRLAALQTLKVKSTSSPPSSTNNLPKTEVVQPVPVPVRPRNEFIRGGAHRGRNMRNASFQRHHANPNLIAIVPIRETATPSNCTTEMQSTKVNKPLMVKTASPKLVLPQDRYCKTEETEGSKEPEVPTKFNRFEHSSSESSAEESEEEKEDGPEETDRKQASDVEADPDVLLVKDEDEDDSLEKLMNEMEEEMATDSILPHKNKIDKNKNALKQHSDVNSSARKKTHKSVKKEDTKPATDVESSQVAVKSHSPLISSTGADVVDSRQFTAKQISSEEKYVRSPISHSQKISPRNQESPKQFYQLNSPAKSPHKILYPPRRDSRSLSPRPKSAYSPDRSPLHSRSPLRSRSPIHSRSPHSPRRSRSPFRISRSPRRKYSPVDRYSGNHLVQRSPRRESISPRLRRLGSPRRSLSPRRRSPRSPRRAVSPRRSPFSSRRLSPRRQSISPKFRHQSVSPASRIRRSISPRRPSPISYRRRSPSPARRNQSPPLRRYSPPRRNPSPPRRRLSRSVSRSPGRRHSPVRIRTPLSRCGSRRLTPQMRKASPWTPVRQQAGNRISPGNNNSPASMDLTHKSMSPYIRARRRSNSPTRRQVEEKIDYSNRMHSPRHGDLRRPLQESRLNNIRKSCSPQHDANISRQSPHLTRSPAAKSWSYTSSLSLSPSPERNNGETTHRMKSPLRVHKCPDFCNNSAFREDSVNNRSQNASLPVLSSEERPRKTAKRRKESRKGKKNRNRKNDSQKMRDDNPPPSSSTENRPQKTTETVNCTNPVLEARRRKFESSVPIESSNKRIRLKKSGESEEVPKVVSSKPPTNAPIIKTEDLETLLDLELKNAVELWSDEDSSSDTESRFKTPEKSAPVTHEILPASFQKISSGSAAFTKDKPKVKANREVEDRISGDHSSKEAVQKDTKNNRVLNQEKHIKHEEIVEKQDGKHSVEPEAKRLRLEPSGIEALEQEDGSSEKVEQPSKEGDLRAELSRRRAKRLTMAGSVHETVSARLVQSAFKDAVGGKKNFRSLDRGDRNSSSKRAEHPKGIDTDGRRVLVLKSSTIEQQIPSISVTIPKDEKHKRGSSPSGRLPIHMRLGLPTGNSFPEERERPASSRRRGSRKVKLKRSVLLASAPGEKVMCGSSLYLTLGSMRHCLLCSPFFLPCCGHWGIRSSINAQLCFKWKLILSITYGTYSYYKISMDIQYIFKGILPVHVTININYDSCSR